MIRRLFLGEPAIKASVIISTYNQPEWLAKCLTGFAGQDRRDFEIVIADDGSDERTAQVIHHVRAASGLNIEHVRHEDRGFRKCLILNRAILAAKHEYLIFTDGDCIPTPGFVTTHLRLARSGCFLSGGYFKLTGPVSQLITEDDVRSGRCFSVAWLRKHGQPLKTGMIRLWSAGRSIGRLLDQITTTRPTWNGHQASTFKEYLLEINGFDHRMGYGGEDRELGERLVNLGIRPIQVRHRAICLHLDHSRGYISEQVVTFNRTLRENTRRNRVVRTPDGISELAGQAD